MQSRFSATFRSLALLAALISMAALTSCSPGAFFGDGKDKQTENLPTYRKVNVACSGLKLDKAMLDTKTFKSLVDCFNSDGALPELAKLVHTMSERDLHAVVQAINRHVISNPRVIYGLEKSFFEMEDQKILDPLLRNTSKILANQELVSAALGILKDKSILDSVSGYLGIRYEIGDKNVLRALEMIGEKVDAPGTLSLLDQALLITRSREFPVLEQKLLAPSPSGRKLDDLIANLIHYVSEDKKLPVGKRFVDSLLSGQLLKAFDGLVGDDPASVQVNVPKLGAVMRTMLENDGKIMRDMGRLFGVLADPISCLKGAKSIKAVSMSFLSEVISRTPESAAEFILQGSVLDHAAISPFCNLRPELDLYYPAVAQLAGTSTFTATHELLKSLAAVQGTTPGSQPLLELFVDFISDSGASQSGGFQLLLPLLSELSDRGAWDDLTLIATLSTSDSRGSLLPDTVKFLTEPAAKLGNLSVSDVFSSALSRVANDRARDLVVSIGDTMRSHEAIAQPALTSLRDAYFANSAHPFIELASDFLTQATANDELFSTLLTYSSSSEFKAFLGSLDRMSQSGQLKDLMGALLTMFHDYGAREAYAISGVAKPLAGGKVRHDLISTELPAYVGKALLTKLSPDCSLVKMTFPLEQYTDPGFGAELDHMTACLNSNNARPDAAQAIAFARSAKVDDGRSFLGFNIDFLKGLPFQAPELGFLSDAWMRTMDDGRFYRTLDAVPLWVPALKPLFGLINPVMTANRVELQRLESFGGKLLKRDDLIEVVRYADDLVNSPVKSDPVYVPAPHLEIETDRLFKWIQNKECDISQNVGDRARLILDDYANAINNWEVFNGVARRRWTMDEFRPRAEEALQKLAEPSVIPVEENPDSQPKYLVDAVLNVLKYFTLKPGQKKDRFRHYEPKELAEWLYRRSNDYRPMTYFYPTEDKPRVRYANTLDMMELVLVNADYVAPWPFSKNFALEFSALIGGAWGDETQDVWPQEILDEYKNTGVWPLKLSEAVTKLWDSQLQFELILGYPDIPKCTVRDPSDPDDMVIPKYGISVPTWLPLPGQISTIDLKKSLYNLRQVLHVLEENNPTNDHDTGLRVLRDLFFQAYYSNKPENRDSKAGLANDLSFVLRLTRMGLTREISRQMRLFPNKDANLDDFMSGLIQGAISPEVRKVTHALIVDDANHELIWKVFGKIFDVINASEGLELTADRKALLKGKSPTEIQAIHAQWIAEEAGMKSLGFYGLANLPALNVTDPGLKVAGAVLGKYRTFLTDHADKVESLFKSEKASHLMRALYESQDTALKSKLSDILRETLADPQVALDGMAVVKTIASDQALSDRLDLFSDQADALLATPEYRNLKLGEIGRQFADFLEERTGAPGTVDPLAVQTAHLLRLHLADRLQAGDVDQILRVAAQNPDGFYHLLETLGIHVKNGDLKDFFGYVRRNLSN